MNTARDRRFAEALLLVWSSLRVTTVKFPWRRTCLWIEGWDGTSTIKSLTWCFMAESRMLTMLETICRHEVDLTSSPVQAVDEP